MMPKAAKLTGGYNASTVAEATRERDVLAVILERRGFLPDDFLVGGKSKAVDFTVRGEGAAIQSLRDSLAGRAFAFPGFWTQVSDTPEG